MKAEQLAQIIHEAHERLAPAYGLSVVGPWRELADSAERQLAIAVAATVLSELEQGTQVSPVQYVLQRWTAFCQQSTGTDDCYVEDGQRYRWSVAKQHADGVVTGGVFAIEPGAEPRKVSSFKIRTDGRVGRAPLPLRRVL